MPAFNEITAPQLARLIGLPDAPVVLDVRSDDAFARDARLLPTALRRDARAADSWAPGFAGKHVVVSCQHGASLSQGAAAWLRQHGAEAESLEGGHEAWVAAGGLLVDAANLPPRDEHGRTV